MGAKPSKTLMDTIIEVKLTKKRLEAAQRKAEKQHGMEKQKVLKAIEQGNLEGARVYAENAIRKKSEALQMLRLAARMDAVASKLDTAEKTQAMSQNISDTIPQLDDALTKMTPEAIATNMDQFEKIFDDLDVRMNYITTAVDSTTASATPTNEVDLLIQQVGEEHAMDVSNLLNQDGLKDPLTAAILNPAAGLPGKDASKDSVGEDLESRLAALRS
ncbi:unnamed protein product [Amoebophrya sp. A120]|nr:unnamed protein product [Amoebophrya sp. A120]|eukprot:GSA120T00019195001.1